MKKAKDARGHRERRMENKDFKKTLLNGGSGSKKTKKNLEPTNKTCSGFSKIHAKMQPSGPALIDWGVGKTDRFLN